MTWPFQQVAGSTHLILATATTGHSHVFFWVPWYESGSPPCSHHSHPGLPASSSPLAYQTHMGQPADCKSDCCSTMTGDPTSISWSLDRACILSTHLALCCVLPAQPAWEDLGVGAAGFKGKSPFQGVIRGAPFRILGA